MSRGTDNQRLFLQACMKTMEAINEISSIPDFRAIQDSFNKVITTLDVYDEEFDQLMKLMHESRAKMEVRK